MKKAKTEANDWLRPENSRADFGPIMRNKYARRIAAESNVVVIDPAVSKVFRDEKPLNAALRGLLVLARSTTRPSLRSNARAARVPARRTT
jgi:hypothetical protein